MKDSAFQNILFFFYRHSDYEEYQGAWNGWLKELAFINIPFISLTLDTFHLLSGWLKEVAS